MLKIENIKKSFGKKVILDNLSLQLNQPSIVAIVGENGSGKTTLFNIISDFLKNDDGSIILDKNVKVSGIIEYPKFYPYMSGANNLNVLPHGDKNKQNEYIKLFKMENDINLLVSKYSLGMRQKLAIIYVLSKNSKIVLLDEPTNSLDPQSIETLRNIIKREKENGRIIIISSHNLYFIDDFADKIFLLKNKQLTEISTSNQKYYLFKVRLLKECEAKLIQLKIQYYIENERLHILNENFSILEIVKLLNPFDILEFSKEQALSELYLEAIDETRI